MDNETFGALKVLISTIGEFQGDYLNRTPEDVFMYHSLAEVRGMPEAWLKVWEWIQAKELSTGAN